MRVMSTFGETLTDDEVGHMIAEGQSWGYLDPADVEEGSSPRKSVKVRHSTAFVLVKARFPGKFIKVRHSFAVF